MRACRWWQGLRFNFKCEGGSVPVFAIRHRGKVYAYLNRCAHVGLELDWIEGEFFNDLGLYLICSMHGATYAPDTGLGRPCKGASLERLAVEEITARV